MSVTRAELQDAIGRAFDPADLAPDAAASWDRIAELGIPMMTVAEERGGLGLGLEAAGVIHTTLGRALVPGGTIAHLLAVEALAASDAGGDLLDRAMAGERLTASLSVDGSLTAVPDADVASHVLVIGDTVRLVPLTGATLAPRETWDRTRRLFDVTVIDDGIVLAEGEEARTLAERLTGRLLFALAGDSLGGAETILALTIDYLKQRRQFDRPLAMFQALKHRVADMKTRLSAADALFWSRATEAAPTLTQMGALKALATEVYAYVAEEAVQLHGGIGLTMEHPCHLFLKRAMLNRALGGDNDGWAERAGRAVMATA